MIQEIIDEAKPQNTFFTIEPMPWMYPTSPEEYVKLLDDVKRDAFGVHMDVINMINTPQRYFFPEPFVEHCFELLGDQIKSCHLKDILLGIGIYIPTSGVCMWRGNFLSGMLRRTGAEGRSGDADDH